MFNHWWGWVIHINPTNTWHSASKDSSSGAAYCDVYMQESCRNRGICAYVQSSVHIVLGAHIAHIFNVWGISTSPIAGAYLPIHAGNLTFFSFPFGYGGKENSFISGLILGAYLFGHSSYLTGFLVLGQGVGISLVPTHTGVCATLLWASTYDS